MMAQAQGQDQKKGTNQMTKDEILAMKAGSAFDELIAIEVMGYERSQMRDGWVRIGALGTYPKQYSTDISAAWEVVEKISSKGYDLKLHCVPLVVNRMFDCTINNDEVELAHVAMKSTAPEAICKAALLAVMKELPKDIGTTEQLSHEVTEAVSGFSDQIKE